MSEERIQFNAKKGKWYVSKKIKIDETSIKLIGKIIKEFQ